MGVPRTLVATLILDMQRKDRAFLDGCHCVNCVVHGKSRLEDGS
jgi:hypothetical protein